MCGVAFRMNSGHGRLVSSLVVCPSVWREANSRKVCLLSVVSVGCSMS